MRWASRWLSRAWHRRHSAGRKSCSTAERTDDSGTHHLDWRVDTGKKALECCRPLLDEHFPAVRRLDAAFPHGVHPARLARSVHEVERSLHPGDVIDVNGERIVTGEPQRCGIDRDVDLDRPAGD